MKKPKQTQVERVAGYLRERPNAKPMEISKELGLSVSRVYSLLSEIKRIEASGGEVALSDEGKSLHTDFGEQSGTVTTRSSDIRTLEQAIKAANVDTNEWIVDRHTINSWEVTIAKKGTGTGKPETFTNFQVKVWLRRKSAAEKSIERIVKTLNHPASRITPHVSLARSGQRSLLELALYDAHFGMLAWGQETGENYDLKIARDRYVTAVDDLLGKAKGFGVERIIFPIGNDFFHMDSECAVTPRSKNHLDKDGRLCKILEIGEEAVTYAIERCAKVAPVDVFWIPGNHDPLLSYNLCRVVAAYFRQSPTIKVDTSPLARKYLRYGNTLLGFTHGCDENHNTLPSLMASERPKDFGAVETREFHLGHFHKRRETHFNGVDSKHSVTVRILPSLAGTDAWHFQKGYVGGKRAADALLYDYETGFSGTFTSVVR